MLAHTVEPIGLEATADLIVKCVQVFAQEGIDVNQSGCRSGNRQRILAKVRIGTAQVGQELLPKDLGEVLGPCRKLNSGP